jgi:hypothetical protein
MLIFLLVILSFFSYGASLEGTLLERGTRTPLKDVNIFLLPHKLKAVSDLKGRFVFTQVPVGECELVVNLSGYKKYSRTFSCTEGASFKIFLEKIFYTTFETTVTAKAIKRDDQAQSLTQEEFLKAPGSFGGDPVRAAQNLPGVAASGANAQIIVQGASPDDTGYVINGHRVPIVFHFGGLSSVIIPEAVERVDLLPAGYGPEYSRAIGGIIGLTTKKPKEDRLHGMAYVDLLNTGGLVEGPIDDTSSFLISGRYSYIGQVLKTVASKNEDFSLTAAPTYYDSTAIYRKRLNEKNEFKTTAIFSKDKLELILNKPANDQPKLRGNFSNRTEFFRIIPQLTTRLNETTSMDHSLGVGRDNLLVRIGGRYLDVNSSVLSHRSEIQKTWSGTYKTYFGLDNEIDRAFVRINLPNSFSVGGVNTPFSVGETRKFDTDVTSAQLGAYFRQEIKPSQDSRWTFLPNLRVDHLTITNETSLQPRLSSRYQWGSGLQLHGSFGKYTQAPQPQETSEDYGNKNLKSPYAYHYMLGYKKDFKNGGTQGWDFTNNFFYKDLQNLVVPDVQNNYENGGTGKIYGGEVQAKWRKEEWSGQVVYTLLKSERTIPGFGTRPAEFDQTHNLNLIGAFNSDRWTYSARFRYVSGLPYTPVRGASFDTDNDVYIPLAGQLFSQRFNDFKQLDIRIDRKFIYDEWILSAYVDIQNITNSENAQNIEYSFDYSSKEKVRGLPILPTFGVKGEF